MGKRTRKTRWRTLPIGVDEQQSDSSDDSNPPKHDRMTNGHSNVYHQNHHNNNNSHQKYYNNKFTFSSQSTPIRRYQNGDNGSAKSTRSSSTTSENKITFNEDEYMRITTPRQDVLFKKGYLNKPKTYSTQTSTGNSTNSTGNSTGNGTPDYHGTDLEYESQFVFPNGFMDQNGIYYINSGYDPYPLMVYSSNPPTYYNNIDYRSKKYSTESLAETTSTNEEKSQDEIVQTPSPSNGHLHPSEFNNQHQIYNMIYPPPPFYYNNGNGNVNSGGDGLCMSSSTTTSSTPSQELINGHHHQTESKRMIKRRRRRKVPTTKENDHHRDEDGTTSEYTEDEDEQHQQLIEENHQVQILHQTPPLPPATTATLAEETAAVAVNPSEPVVIDEETPTPTPTATNNLENSTASGETAATDSNSNENCDNVNRGCETVSDSSTNPNCHQANANTADMNNLNLSDKKYDLKPDAQEFVPRSMMRPEQQQQFFKIPPNFVPVPLLNPLGAQNFNHAYIPPGIPVNFIQQYPPPGFVPSYGPPPTPQPIPQQPLEIEEVETVPHPHPHQLSTTIYVENNQTSVVTEEVNSKSPSQRNRIDIETVVSKLEEVAKPQHQKIENKNEAKPQVQQQFRKEFRSREDVRKNTNNYQSPRRIYNNNNNLNGRIGNAATTVSNLPNSPKSPKKYSETVKKPVQILQHQQTVKNKKPASPEVNNTPTNPTNISSFSHNSSGNNNSSRPPQWISVSSKKKRRNRANVEDSEFEIEKTTAKTNVENFENVENVEIKMLEVSELEKELLNNVGKLEKMKEIKEIQEIQQIPEQIQAKNEEIEIEIASPLLPTPPTSTGVAAQNQTVHENEKPKKKTKNKTNSSVKTPPKRVMITDKLEPEISQTAPNTPEIEKIEIDPPKVPEPKTEAAVATVEAPDNPPEKETAEVAVVELEKKSKKKKRKPKILVIEKEETRFDSTSSNATYNFLLGNSNEKTNMEVSQELDLIIQRGMYNSLEEKIKSLNIIPVKEEFFQSVIKPNSNAVTNPSSRESSIEKQPEISKFLSNSMPKFKYCMASVGCSDNEKILSSTSISISDNLNQNQLTTSSNNELFVENLEVNELLNDIYGDKKKEKTPPISTTLELPIIDEAKMEDQRLELENNDAKSTQNSEKYPITRAVKNWMVKTRENTPEVEILKSPSTIFKELRKSISEDDEVTIYSSNSRQNSVDLLECWENEIVTEPNATENSDKDVEDVEEISANGNVEEIPEVYESKFGQNVDYLEIQKEIEEKKRNFPKHGALPYRAICCSIN